MRLLLCGDFDRHTGYATVNEQIAAQLAERGWDVAVLAAGYQGTPHGYPYRLWPCPDRSDFLGLQRLAAVVRHERPDAVLITATPWVTARYLAALPHGQDWPPIAAYMPVDAPRLDPAYVAPLERLALALPYTQFAEDELRAAGYTGPSAVIPHGIDLDLWRPIDQATARAELGLPADAFVVLWLDRNQPRKRLDLAIRGFARFARGCPDALLLLHTGANDVGWSPQHEAAKAGIADRVLLTSADLTAEQGMAVEALPIIYSAADVRLSTTAGEGWGLTVMEAMACGVPCLVPAWAALAEWAAEAAAFYPVTATESSTNRVGTDAAVVDPERVALALEKLHGSPELRASHRAAGLRLVGQERFSWRRIGQQFDQALRGICGGAR